MLRPLIVSKVRIKLLQTFLNQPQEIFYVRQLVRETKEEINAVRRELKNMEEAGMVKKENRGNRLYYWLEKDHLLYGDLLSLINKTIGLGGQIISNKNKIGKIKFAVLSGRFIRRQPTKEGGVDLLVVGEINLAKLAQLVKEEEARADREINYSVMSKEEFDFRKKRRDPFLLGILSDSRTILIGDELEIVS